LYFKLSADLLSVSITILDDQNSFAFFTDYGLKKLLLLPQYVKCGFLKGGEHLLVEGKAEGLGDLRLAGIATRACVSSPRENF
jgi:hypothetical protein